MRPNLGREGRDSGQLGQLSQFISFEGFPYVFEICFGGFDVSIPENCCNQLAFSWIEFLQGVFFIYFYSFNNQHSQYLYLSLEHIIFLY